MKRFKSVGLWWVSSAMVCVFCVAASGAGFVYETDAELLTTADLDGDGREDAVIVDKASGTFRAGYQLSVGSFTWSQSRSLGATNITGLSAGMLTSTTRDAIAVATPFLNRVNVIDAVSPTAAIFPKAAYGNSSGHLCPVALQIGATTVYEDLLVSSMLNGGVNDYRVERIQSYGTSFSGGSLTGIGGVWLRGNHVEYDTGLNAAVILDRGLYLRLYSLASGSLSHVASKTLSGITNPDYTVFHPSGTGYAHFALWSSGSSSLRHLALTGSYAFSALVSYDLGSPIAEVFTVVGGGEDRLAVVFADGSAAIYDFDGVTAPVLLQSLGAPPSGSVYSAFLPTAAGSFLALTADEATGISDVGELFNYSGSMFSSAGSSALPAVIAGRVRGNVMVFENEPFISPLPRRLHLLNAGDWTDEVNLIGAAPSDIQAVYETDQGLPDGLGNQTTVNIGAASPLAGYTLANQAHERFSVFSVNAAVGDQAAEAFISPEPGHYRSAVEVSFTNAVGSPVYYRIQGETTWYTYSAPFVLFKDSTVLYFSSDSGDKSIIKTAAYSFDSDPSTLDSDGDGVPDYVELAYGLDPINSGSDADGDGLLDIEELMLGTDPALADSDGDGVSDLNELREGTDPNDPLDTPTEPFDGEFPRIEVSSVFDLVLTPRPYDGVDNVETLSITGAQVRAYSAGGWQYAYGTTTHLGLSGVSDPAVRLEAIPSSVNPGIVCALTSQHFDIATSHTNSAIGLEMVGVYPTPDVAGPIIDYIYGGGDLATEASNWVAAAISAYSSHVRTVVTNELDTVDVLGAMMIERKLVDLLYERGIYTNRVATLFSARTLDASMPSVNQNDLVALQAYTNAYSSYLVSTVVAELNNAAENSGALADLRQLAFDLYDVCSDYGVGHPGSCAQPIDALRGFLLDGSLGSNYLSRISLNGTELAAAYVAANQALAGVSARPSAVFSLEVYTNSFDGVCPVLYTVGTGTAKSLYNSNGSAYVVPASFRLPPGSRLGAEAFTDVTWNDCPGTDPIEVISLSVTAIPTASGTDADGNLLPDAFELNILGSSGNPAYHDSDGDGYSDLQEYLEQTDPMDEFDSPAVPVEDMSPPEILISSSGANQVTVDVDWPAVYASPFIFTVIHTEDLTGGFTNSFEMTKGFLSETLDTTAYSNEFFRVNMQLR